MPKHLSRNEIDSFYKREINTRGSGEVENLIDKKRDELKKVEKRKSIFLSHSHLDKTIVSKMALLFNQLDADIYVDWMDSTLPRVTDAKTAYAIKEKINDCNKFLFLATYRGLQSKWCDWELGVAYSLKNKKDIALLPIESKKGNWKGSEYLGLYPEMEFKITDLTNITANQVSIRYSKTRSVLLETWLNKNKTIK